MCFLGTLSLERAQQVPKAVHVLNSTVAFTVEIKLTVDGRKLHPCNKTLNSRNLGLAKDSFKDSFGQGPYVKDSFTASFGQGP